MHLFASDISDPEDSQEYTATVAGAEFSGSGRPSGYFACGESRIYRAENHLAGRFSADRSRMTADEELVIYLPSGDVVTYHTEWSATKQ